jgi:hypothetical protein
MAQHTEWVVEEREPSWFARLFTPPGASRPAGVAALVAALGAVAYVASLVLDWQRITVTTHTAPEVSESTQAQTFTANLATVDTLSLGYVLGGMAALGLAGACLGRPEIALRLRMATLGVGAGMAGLVLAVTLRLPHSVFGVSGLLNTIYGQADAPPRNKVALSYQPGVVCGFAAVVLPVVAVWLCGQVAVRSKAKPPGNDGQADGGDVDQARPPDSLLGGDWHTTGGFSRGRVAVTASEPLDISVTPGETWST